MYALSELKDKLTRGNFDQTLSHVYGVSDLSDCKARLNKLLDGFGKHFGEDGQVSLFSAPGRTEVGGNHTDHQLGRVLAAAVNLDVVAVVRPNGTETITVQSEGYAPFSMNVFELEYRAAEEGTTLSLVRGIVSKFAQMGYSVMGFDLYATSNVLKGSGLSSSAAFEVLIGTVINCLFCSKKESAIKIAQIGQYAENVFFGKPSGLMDQMASSVGGFVTIDFYDKENPIVERVDFDLAQGGFDLCIVDTGGDHADLTPDYTAITAEMREVATFFGEEVLSRVKEAEFYKKLPEIRKVCSDRAILRAIHFFSDNTLVSFEVAALKKNNFDDFLRMLRQSGRSSGMSLQNTYSIAHPEAQGVSLALAFSKRLLAGHGAYRVHGGGFAGTIQAFVPKPMCAHYKNEMERLFGEGSCYVLSIRPVGGIELTK